MKSNYIATFAIHRLQCRYLSTKVTPLLRSLWPSPVGDRYGGVQLYIVMQLYNHKRNLENNNNTEHINVVCQEIEYQKKVVILRIDGG